MDDGDVGYDRPRGLGQCLSYTYPKMDKAEEVDGENGEIGEMSEMVRRSSQLPTPHTVRKNSWR